MDDLIEAVPDFEIGRILRASTSGYTVGSKVGQLKAPSFGSLVKAQPVDERETIYGLIYNIFIDDDPLVRRLVLVENPRPSIIEDQRSNRLLPIEMSVLAVGYMVNGRVRYGLPPRPPLNLDPVYLCNRNEALAFTENPAYLHLLLRSASDRAHVDQLLAAHLGLVFEQRGRDLTWLIGMVRESADLLQDNYDLLMPALEAISQAIGELDSAQADLFDPHNETFAEGDW